MPADPVRPGFIRIQLNLPVGATPTPGDLVKAVGIALDDLGPIQVEHATAWIDVSTAAGRTARTNLDRLGRTNIVDWQWRWLRLMVGRNHGVTLNQLKKVVLQADAAPLGRIHLNNTHSLVGVQDFRVPSVVAKLTGHKLNGYSLRPEDLPESAGPGSAAFTHA
jgi:hypothetical protein